MQCYREAGQGRFVDPNFFMWTTPTRRAYARRYVTPGYMPRARVTSHRKTEFKETSRSCLSIDMPNGFFRRGVGGVSNSHPPSRARSGVVHVTHCELESPPKCVSGRSSGAVRAGTCTGDTQDASATAATMSRLLMPHICLVLARLLISRESPSSNF